MQLAKGSVLCKVRDRRITMKLTLPVVVMILTMSFSCAYGRDFYAHKEIQADYPQAFATNHSNLSYLNSLERSGKRERDLLINAISHDKNLHSNLLRFNDLTTELQVKVLRELFEIECHILKITPPELVIDEHSIPGYAYFDFDYKTGGPGKVYLNQKKLTESKDKSEFIVLLLHETRHSAQFQLSSEYKEAFKTQQDLKSKGIKFSFCDFMLLLNEFEAFQFANYIYGSLINWPTELNDMGTLASQYDQNGKLRLNLIEVLTSHPTDAIEEFNKLEKIQYLKLGPAM
jgi:hypothetical protein